ncbi:MAG: hypothetical protein C0481_06295 [Phenylobacterium sp.]|uniref:bestrophin-like domain n=1 Tax=Phenylobacterium sp. TaxID=1871053 RepID=UPI0025DEE1B2|nr:hypothetical protein [Phenylobacterium sp.]MBA4011460.1 hypothetical protein [Phenylobacterium sp.]
MGATLLGWLLLTAVLVLAAELGYRLHSRSLSRERGKDESETGEAGSGSGYVLSAALGLMGLLIAFVFSMANDRYVERRQLVLAEANAISTAVLRYQLMPEPHRSELLRTMAQYVKVRLAFYDLGADMERVDEAEARAEAMQAKIWREVNAAVRTPQGAPYAMGVMMPTNDMFNLETSRRAALEERVPPRALHVLVIFAVVTAAIMGHGLAHGRRRHLVSTCGLFVLVALAISLIIDLDNPRVGSVRVPQTPMENVARDVEALAAAPSPSP